MQQLTKKQLVEYFQDYRTEFPEWTVEHKVVLTRTSWPLKQSIAFQALRMGAYRASCSVHILFSIPDGGSILWRDLDIKHREIFPREHAAKWRSVVAAMKERFAPSVCEPLDLHETLRLGNEEAKREGIYNVSYVTGLAALNAYVGDFRQAKHWCGVAEKYLANIGREPEDWENCKAEFILRLRQSMADGTVGELLNPSNE